MASGLSGADILNLANNGKAEVIAGMLNGLAACSPAAPPRQLIESVRSMLMEMRTLTFDDYRPEFLPLSKVLGPTANNGSPSYSDEVIYTVPSEKSLVVVEVTPRVAFNKPALEVKDLTMTDATKGFGTGVGIQDRLLLKAMNCRVLLQLKDATQQLFGDVGLRLSDINPEAGYQLPWHQFPLIVPQNQVLKLNLSLIATATADDLKLVGGDTEYGLNLMAFLVRSRKSG